MFKFATILTILVIFPFFSQAEQILVMKKDAVIDAGLASFPLIHSSYKHIHCTLNFPPWYLERIIKKDKQFKVLTVANPVSAPLTAEELKDLFLYRYGYKLWDFDDDVAGAISEIQKKFKIDIADKFNKITFSIQSISTGVDLKIKCLSAEHFTSDEAIRDMINGEIVGAMGTI